MFMFQYPKFESELPRIQRKVEWNEPKLVYNKKIQKAVDELQYWWDRFATVTGDKEEINNLKCKGK